MQRTGYFRNPSGITFREDVGCFGAVPKTPTRVSPRRPLITPTRIGGAPTRFSQSNSSGVSEISSSLHTRHLRLKWRVQNWAKSRRGEEVVQGLLAGDFFLAGVQTKNRRERVQIGGSAPDLITSLG